MTVDEFFTRYPSLPKFLLGHMSQKSKGLVHPSLVPLLVLFSRMSIGVLKSSIQSDDLVKKFKLIFKETFYSSVINVRKLAASAYTNFTTKHELVSEIQYLCKEISCVFALNTNYTDACLSCINELLKTLKLEYAEEFTANHTALKKSLEKLVALFLEMNCYILKFKILSICKLMEMEIQFDEDLNSGSLRHEGYLVAQPGFKDVAMELSSMGYSEQPPSVNSSEFRSRESICQYLTSLKREDKEKSPDVCRSLQSFLEEMINNSLMTGKVIEQCNELFIKHRIALLEDSELAMEVLDTISSCDEIKLGRLGILAQSTNLMLQTVCFASMMTKSDYKMFFSDESIYVSRFSEMTEQIEKISQPNKMETCRMHGAQSLKNLLSVFNSRNLKSDFDPLMLYAFVTLINTAFTLLFDEDNHVRESITEFVSNLKSKKYYPQKISTVLAIEKLVLFGLEHFSSCPEWFFPVQDVFFRPWSCDTSNKCSKTPVERLENVQVREYLFESGDGINVYVEDAGNNIYFSEVIMQWLSNKNLENSPLKLNINIHTVIEQINSIINYIEGDAYENRGFSSVLWTNQGLLMMLRYYNLLCVVKKYPSVLCDRSRILLEDAETQTITSHISYIKKNLSLFCQSVKTGVKKNY